MDAITMGDLRRDLARVVNSVAFGRERVIVERHGKPLVAVVKSASGFTPTLTASGFPGSKPRLSWMHSREDYRVAYRVDDDARVVTVVWAGHRSRIYEELERRQ